MNEKMAKAQPENALQQQQNKAFLRSRRAAFLLRLLVRTAACITFCVLVFLVGYILIMGVPHLTPQLFSLHYNSENVSLLPSLINTLMLTGLALLLAVPLGIFAAIYLVEYTGRGNRLVRLIRLTTETLSGIPSIVYGLFGQIFFVTALRLNYSLIAGALTITIMILPLIIRTTEEALLSVPDAYREGSFGLGAGRLRTVFRIVLPPAAPGILAGVILAIGRIVGETAALIFTSGTVPDVANGLGASARTLSVHMYLLATEGLHMEESYATAVVLMVLVVGINTLSACIARRVAKREG